MNRVALLVFLLFLAVTGVFADDQLRSVQQVLKDQGFYNGQVDGVPGNETDAAVKRYQIRNGLQVTGQVNPETLAAMNLGGNPAPTQQSILGIQPKMPDTVSVPGNDLKSQSYATPQPAMTPQAVVNPYPVIFRKTPYETAPAEVQMYTLKRAQMKLYRAGYYRGTIDGVPGTAMVQALTRYQTDERLPATGQLDMDTLASLDLLPRSGGPVRSYYDPQAPARPVYRGIWVH